MSFRHHNTGLSDTPEGRLVTAPAVTEGKTSHKIIHRGAHKNAAARCALPAAPICSGRAAGKVSIAFRGHGVPSPAPPALAVRICNQGTMPAKLNRGDSIDMVISRANDEFKGFAR
jgi:hypothetical protein